MTLGLLIPAAGASSRMRGRDKLLEEIDGTPLLIRQLRAALRLDLPVLVTLPPSASPRRALLLQVADPNLETQRVPDASVGISASLRTGAHWAADKGLTGMMVVLPDMPDITADDLQSIATLHQMHPRDVIRATDALDNYGHPTVLPARLLPDLVVLQGDAGAREILAREKIRACPLAGNKATTDLDTPEAWRVWRAGRD